MARFIVSVSLFMVFVVSAFAQTSTPQISSSSDSQAIAIATKSVVAMTSGVGLKDATLQAAVTWIAGSDNETGSGTFSAKGIDNSRIDLSLSNETRSEARSANSQGLRLGQWKKGASKVASSQNNCWTDAAWFLPALTSLAQFSNPSFVFSYVGQEQHNGLPSLHVKVIRILPDDTPSLDISRHGAMDFYIDPNSFIPLAVTFNLHPDADLGRDIPTEIRFADYRNVNGIQIPFHIQRLINNGLSMDIVVSNAEVNTGLSDTQFSLQ